MSSYQDPESVGKSMRREGEEAEQEEQTEQEKEEQGDKEVQQKKAINEDCDASK